MGTPVKSGILLHGPAIPSWQVTDAGRYEYVVINLIPICNVIIPDDPIPLTVDYSYIAIQRILILF